MTNDNCWLTKRMATRIWLLMLGVLIVIGLAVKMLLMRPRTQFVSSQHRT